ncbi:N-methylhydantoinase A [Candidatus Burkholderia humilis]|nr:N-methylhydantoinase A [Candidatus Burkholderia humilis]
MFTCRTTFDDGATYDTPRYDRSLLLGGNALDGPAIVVQRDSTTLVPPGYRARVVSNGQPPRSLRRSAMKNGRVDPVTLQVISGALHTIAEEMSHVLYCMSFSSIIRESQDIGAGLFDLDFNTLTESEGSPLHIGSIPAYLRGIGCCL